MDKNKFQYGLTKVDGIIKGVRNGVTGRVDKMFITVLVKLLKDLELNIDEEKIKTYKETLTVKENKKEEITYRNYYINNKKIMCIRDNNFLIGEIYLDDNMASIMLELLEMELLKNKPEASKDNFKKDKKTNRRRGYKSAEQLEFEEETKKILSTISEEDMKEKGFSFISAEDYQRKMGH